MALDQTVPWIGLAVMAAIFYFSGKGPRGPKGPHPLFTV